MLVFQVLEMPNTKKCVSEAAKRLKDKFTYCMFSAAAAA